MDVKYSKSKALLDRAKRSLAGGVSSEFRKYGHPHALFYTHANGVRLYDADGNEYLDFTLSQGPMIVGHSHPHVLEKVLTYSAKGQLFAGQHMLEIELAEKLQKYIPSAELMRFCLDGTTAIQTAFRLARAKTGKQKFVRFEGQYHGWLDNVSWGISGSEEQLGPRNHPTPVPWTRGMSDHSCKEFIILPWNDLDLLQQVIQEHHREIAAIITEPIMCNSSCILPKEGFLKGVRQLCDQYDITLIFDEVITGFRTSLGGAQSYYNIIPDLSIFAKAMASGYPISAIVGKREWMKMLESGEVIHAGTMNSACPLVAAALATIEVLEDPGTHDRIFSLGCKLMDGLKEAAKITGENLLVQGLGPMLHTGFANTEKVEDFRGMKHYDKVKSSLFISRLHDKGIRVIGRGLWYISAVHTEADIDLAIEKSLEVLKELNKK
ncbi:MAG: aspartate aminotransferase family protein [Cyclobacteriaceae bacterium]|nr:aspartate aminotransferase family protein [Cyclobacteriaceae bacterium SS2]